MCITIPRVFFYLRFAIYEGMANIPQPPSSLASPRLFALYLPIRSSFSHRSFHFSLSLSLCLGCAYGHRIFIEIQAGFIPFYSHVSRYSPLLSYTELINLYRVLGFAFASSRGTREEGLTRLNLCSELARQFAPYIGIYVANRLSYFHGLWMDSMDILALKILVVRDRRLG